MPEHVIMLVIFGPGKLPQLGASLGGAIRSFKKAAEEEPNNRRKTMKPKAISFVAKSGACKTTLLEKVIVPLKERGYRVGVIKHDAHLATFIEEKFLQ